jgi:hypothetical protein
LAVFTTLGQHVALLLFPFQGALPQTHGQIKKGITHIDIDGDGVALFGPSYMS